MPPKDGTAPGPGDRLLARLDKQGKSYEARIIRRLERETQTRLIGVLREAPSAGWRLVPIDKRARTEYALDKADLGGAKHNELVAAEPRPGRISGFARVKVVERIGSMDSPKTISLIAIHDHGIPTEFPGSRDRGSQGGRAGRSAGPHRPARHSAGDHRPARRARP